MFPHTSKSRFSSFSEESEPIFGKEKRVSTFSNWSKLLIFSLFLAIFDVFSTEQRDALNMCRSWEHINWLDGVYRVIA